MSTTTWSTTTAFDSGGSVAITEDHTNDHIDLAWNDPYYTSQGWFCFRLDNAAGIPISFQITDPLGRMPTTHQMTYSYSLGAYNFNLMSETVDAGWTFTPEQNTCYISTWAMYPYQATYDRAQQVAADHPHYVTLHNIGQSQGGRDMVALQIEDPSVDDALKDDSILITRQHPGETQGSYHLDAAINYLLDTLENTVDTFHNRFHIIPHMNPDGIAGGFHRHHPDGHDFNRKWVDGTPAAMTNVQTYLSNNVSAHTYGADFHSTTNANFDALWYHSASENTAEDTAWLDAMAANSLSLTGKFHSDGPDRSAGWIWNNFGALCPNTEVWTYNKYTQAELEQEGVAHIKDISDQISPAPERIEGTFSIDGTPTQGAKITAIDTAAASPTVVDTARTDDVGKYLAEVGYETTVMALAEYEDPATGELVQAPGKPFIDVTTPPTPLPQPVGTPLAWWPNDEGSGTVMADNVGTLDGTINGATWVSDPSYVGDAVLDYLDPAYTEIPHDPALNVSNANFTICATVGGFDLTNLTTDHAIAYKYPIGDTATPTYGLYWQGGTGRWRFRVRDTGGTESAAGVLNTDVTPVDGKLRLVGRRVGDTSALFVNGTQVRSNTTALGDSNNTHPLNIGRVWTSASFDGAIDDIILYDYALSDAEIASDYDRQPWSP